MKQKQQKAEQGEDAFSGCLCAVLWERKRVRKGEREGSRREGSREEGRELKQEWREKAAREVQLAALAGWQELLERHWRMSCLAARLGKATACDKLWEEDEHNAHLASLAFRYRPEEDAWQEGWTPYVLPATQGDHRVFRKWKPYCFLLYCLCVCACVCLVQSLVPIYAPCILMLLSTFVYT